MVDTREIYFSELRGLGKAKCYDFQRLTPGNEVHGPSVIWTPITTVVVNPGQRAVCDPYRNLHVFVSDSFTMSSIVDPFTFEIIRHKLFRVIDEAVITLGKSVSAPPLQRRGMIFSSHPYRADGMVLLCGLGYLHHIIPATQAVKHILASFSENPGIFEDDVFVVNDPYTVAMHAPDIFMISPVFHRGNLASWIVNYVHVTDIGGIDFGGFCANAKECFQEGFSTKGLKLIERGKIRKDVLETFLNMVRDPGMTGLDLRSQIAADNVAKQRLVKLYDEYGVDTVDAVGETLIDQSEKQLRARLAELPDGVWRERQYLDLPDRNYKIELAATKQGDTLSYDFTGTDPQAAFPINCCYWATKGASALLRCFRSWRGI